MKMAVWVAVTVMAGASYAHANAWDDYANSYNNFIANASTSSEEEKIKADQKLQDLQKKADKLQERESKDTEKLLKQKEIVKSLETAQKAIETELTQLQATVPPAPKKFLFFSKKSTQQKHIEEAQQKLALVNQELDEQKAKQDKAEQELARTSTELGQMQTSADQTQKAVNLKAENLKRISNPNWQLLTAQNQARALFENQRQNSFDGRLLFTDLQVLQQKNKLSSLQVQALQQTWDTQLNGTLMGEYVNDQVKKAMASTCDPKFQAACAAGKVEALNAVIDPLLNAGRAPASATEVDTGTQNKSVRAPTLRAAPAKNQGSDSGEGN